MYEPRARQSIRPTAVGVAGVAQVCHGDTTSAAYADMNTLPDRDAATAGQKLSTRRSAGALKVSPFGWVTGYPIATRSEASNAARIGTGVLHVAPPSVDLLHTADEWQFAYTEAMPE